MDRRTRHDEPDAVFHITARVNWRFWHLAPDRPARMFLELLQECAEEFGVDRIGAQLMSNHYHFVARSPDEELFGRLTTRRTKCRHRLAWPRGHLKCSVISQFMHQLMWRSARAIQAELGLSGHFWEDRYDAVRIRSARQLVYTLAYDHLNPVREGMVERPEDYPRSSAAWWAGTGDSPILLVQRPLPFGLDKETLRKRVLACQQSRRFREATLELEVDGASPYSPEGQRQLREALRKRPRA